HEKVAGMAVAALGLLAAGLFWAYDFPLNKPIWTSSFVLYTSGWAVLGLAATYWIVDVKGITWWTKPFLIFGTNAIFAFVASGFLAITMGRIKFPDGGGWISMKAWLYKYLFQSWLQEPFGTKFTSFA